MGFFRNLGKSIAGAGRSIGKTLTSGVSHLGKSAIDVGRGITGVIDRGIGAVKQVAGVIEKIPVVGSAAKALLDTPVGKEISAAFNTVSDVNDALKEAVDIGQSVVDLSDHINQQLSKRDLSSADKKELLRRISKTGGKISKSRVAKKAGKINEVQKNIKKFNALVKRAEKVVGKKEVQKLKQIVR